MVSFWGTLNIRCRIRIGTPKRDHNFDNHPCDNVMIYLPLFISPVLDNLPFDSHLAFTIVVSIFFSIVPILPQYYPNINGHHTHPLQLLWPYEPVSGRQGFVFHHMGAVRHASTADDFASFLPM